MASKSLLFLLAFVLLVSTQVMSTEEEIFTQNNQHHHASAPTPAPGHSKSHSPSPKKAPSHAPKKAPTHPPKRAPAYPPKMAPMHSPKHAPTYPPKAAAPAYAPTHPNHGNCVDLCVKYCKNGKQAKRPCVKTCVPCCDVHRCVPGHNKKCANWGQQVHYHGRPVNCP
ncbi:OLC1v1011222C1 [Oldenlandia corymbosa var. corymbosa]|uniref:OLC1v1011222C1 n=1 Tax=Oldenlandia corymbosa var. corymbosa TaxID=529605 RepID=A0AAV1DT81_OLDCO|nr:OLC1v1011222C1 [Oldenlandia corymbosa var. corymbosa]